MPNDPSRTARAARTARRNPLFAGIAVPPGGGPRPPRPARNPRLEGIARRNRANRRTTAGGIGTVGTRGAPLFRV